MDPPRPPSMRAGIAASTVFQTPMRFHVDDVAEDLAAVSLAAESDDAGVGQDDVETAELADAFVDGLF